MIKIAICDDERELREATAARLCGRRTAATSWRCWILSWER